MRFGGHETFSIREGWLHKGLKLLVDEPKLLVDDYSADYLGVGRNMAKSIRHWLQATGLAQKATSASETKKPDLIPTEIGKLVWCHDPYFVESGTWWMLHVNLVRSRDHAASWSWFFNNFGLARFERAVCSEGLRRYLKLNNQRMPAKNTLDRDIACLLNTYAKWIPAEKRDPEEATECPFTELGLMNHFRESGYFQMNQGMKDVPAELFGYGVSLLDAGDEGNGPFEHRLSVLVQAQDAPGRLFCLTNESLFETVVSVEKTLPKCAEIVGLAGERILRLERFSPIEWIERYYSRIEELSKNAA